MALSQAAATAIVGGAQAGMGVLQMIGQRRRERRAMENEVRLMNIHQQHQLALNRHGQQLQQETWERTNYPAQVKMLQEAGMNPALLYGKGGSGGVTGSQGGGSAAMGHAPGVQPMPTMDLAQIAKLKSEIKVNESIANKNNADAGLSGAKEQESIAALGEIAANINNKNAQTELLQIEKDLKDLELNLKNRTLNVVIRKAEVELEQANQTLRSLKVKGDLDEATYQNALKLSTNAVIKSGLDNILTRVTTDKNRQEIETQKKELLLKAEELVLKGKSVKTEQFKADIAAFEAAVKANFPNIWNVAGAGVINFVNRCRQALGGDPYGGDYEPIEYERD
jgi:hypothetical protein